MEATYRHYPFSAVVGQDELKTALLLNAVNPRLGGVLIRGEKGTAKSTAVRALAALLPKIETLPCEYGCDPRNPSVMCAACHEAHAGAKEVETVLRSTRVVDLPVGATEDRLVGTLDIERAIKHGEKHFEPGILARANRGILYVDEVNLLEDHLVDVLLDAAAMGVNTVEREGVSFSHPAQFMLVGTMNPEEGELRPQLLDRFGLCVTVSGVTDVDARVEVVKRRVEFEGAPERFVKEWAGEEERIATKIEHARMQLPLVTISDDLLRFIATISVSMDVDGHRADITMMKCAQTLAAWDGVETVDKGHVHRAAELCLGHRMRRKPFEDVGVHQEKLEIVLAQA
ncbi:ATP-binding protein [Salidesulfovibrio brasiliensis]|uniref:ATP-binding protein n=1 Tax=Salidesulfovibrio brasiliensis TaxID=221711 RepID=UPI0006D1AA75|nr:ATP-binding protein [Salidesulfovibrio brasiliensis]